MCNKYLCLVTCSEGVPEDFLLTCFELSKGAGGDCAMSGANGVKCESGLLSHLLGANDRRECAANKVNGVLMCK